MRRVKIYTRFERFWHWAQAVLVILLALTGFDIHFGWGFFDWELGVSLHVILAWAFLILVVFAAFWHFTTGQWKQYLPAGGGMAGAMLRYYLGGIFRNESHPVKKTELSKLNPLQRIAYALLKIILIPALVVTGVLYANYNDLAAASLGVIAQLHAFLAFLMVAFMFGHMYLSTTGRTFWSNYKAMITGWEDVEED
ncbi:MAG: cytochrome b/b6 domain-containing protein [Candidatus Krumholzibacteriota bacterium]|nr:cytochrome b/b6 domain-containing protein [Candidatus Krumholzibacteriota bacterium]